MDLHPIQGEKAESLENHFVSPSLHYKKEMIKKLPVFWTMVQKAANKVILFYCFRMSDGGLLLSWNDSSHTTYMKEEVDRLVLRETDAL